MTTSGTTDFNLTVNEIIEISYELVGGEFITGWDAKMARKFFNLLLIDLQNRNHPLGKLEEVTVTTSTGVRDYTLGSDVIDVMSAVLRRDAYDTVLNRVSLFEDHEIPVKSQQSRPFQFTVDRDRDNVKLRIWPTAENSTDTIRLWVVKKIEDVTGARQSVDLSSRFQPALVFGLAYLMSFKRPNMDVNKQQRLKEDYEQHLENAFYEDKERTSLYVTPRVNKP